MIILLKDDFTPLFSDMKKYYNIFQIAISQKILQIGKFSMIYLCGLIVILKSEIWGHTNFELLCLRKGIHVLHDSHDTSPLARKLLVAKNYKKGL